jgi:hypothetical protein
MWHLRSESDRPVAYFEYQPGRSSKFLKSLLTDYGGVIMTDGLNTYDSLMKTLTCQHAGCMAHARRYFYEVYDKDNKDHVAKEILKLIGSLFALEEIYSRHKFIFRLKWRKRFSAPLMNNIYKILQENKDKHPPKSGTGKAIDYAINQWEKLSLFLKNADAEIHNNAVERGIRPFVIGRKNWLFSVSPNGANSSAALYSLVETAKVNNLNPYDYLTYLFEKFPKCQTEDEMKALLPNRVQTQDIQNFFKKYCQV